MKSSATKSIGDKATDAADGAGLKKPHRLYRPAGRFESLHQKNGLHLWYEAEVVVDDLHPMHEATGRGTEPGHTPVMFPRDEPTHTRFAGGDAPVTSEQRGQGAGTNEEKAAH